MGAPPLSLAKSTGVPRIGTRGDLGSLDFGLQRTLPDIDFPPTLPSASSPPPVSPYLTHFGLLSSAPPASSLLLVSPSFSLLSPRSLILPTSPSLCPSFCSPPALPRGLFLRLLLVPLPPVYSECSPERRPIWRHRTKCVKAWRSTAPHTLLRTHTHRPVSIFPSLPFSALPFSPARSIIAGAERRYLTVPSAGRTIRWNRNC